MDTYDTIAAISTAVGEAGIAIVRTSGDNSIEIVDKIFKAKSKKKLKDSENRKFIYGHIYDNDKIIDEVLAVKMLGPHSYSGENIVEIHCHGGIVAVRRILNLLLANGARLAQKGEFTKRGFLNGRIDLSQAEAVIDLIKAKTEDSFDISMKQLKGSISKEVEKIEKNLVGMQALIVANIDFPEDEVEDATYDELKRRNDEITLNIRELLNNAGRGKLLREGINTLILGKPNVGKSSLLNGMLKYERAIVTDIPGTTRDTIEDYINLDGLLLKVTDTAGIRQTDDEVEKIGVKIARDKIKEADLVIVIFDLSRPFNKDDREILDLIQNKKALFIMNKDDLQARVSDEDIKELLNDRDYLKLSVRNPEEIKLVENAIKDMFFSGEIIQKDQVYVNNIRHIDALKKALKTMEETRLDLENEVFLDLVEVNLEEALEEISKITGEITTEDVLDRVFSEFCIGK